MQAGQIGAELIHAAVFINSRISGKDERRGAVMEVHSDEIRF